MRTIGMMSPSPPTWPDCQAAATTGPPVKPTEMSGVSMSSVCLTT
jgi:hypothetical protein